MRSVVQRLPILTVLAGAIAVLACQIAGAIALWRHTSNEPIILGRYAPDYFAFLAGYHLMMAVWAGLAARFALCGLRRPCLERLREHLDRFAARLWLFWGTVAGLCAGMLIYALATSQRTLPAGAKTAPLATLIFAALLVVGGAVRLRLRGQQGPAGTLAVGGALAAALAVLALQVAGAAALWKQIIDSPTFLVFLATYRLMLLGWLGLIVGLTTRILQRRLAGLEAALRRITARRALFWGLIGGLWALTALLLSLSTRHEIAGTARFAVFLTPMAARLALSAFAGYAAAFTAPVRPAGAEAGRGFARLGGWASYLLRRDALALVLFGEVTALFTYPALAELGRVLVGIGALSDTYPAVWQDWWLSRAILPGGPALSNAVFRPFSRLLFYPVGLDLTYAGHHWTRMPTFIPLSMLFGPVVAYNINALLALWMAMYFAYLLALYVTHNRRAAWVGGLVYAFWPGYLTNFLATPNTGHAELMPLFVLLFIHALRTQKTGFTLLSAATLAATAYYNVKVTLLSIGVGLIYALWWLLTEGTWRRPMTWRQLALFSAPFLLLIVPVLYPYLAQPRYLEHAIDLYDPGSGSGINLVDLLVPDWLSRRLTENRSATIWAKTLVVKNASPTFNHYLGWSPIALALLAVLEMRREKRHLVWLLIALVFFALSLGPMLQIGPLRLDRLPMPLDLIQNVPFVRILRTARRFAIPAGLGWAVLVALGLCALARRTHALNVAPRALLFGGVAALLLAEYLLIPLDLAPATYSPFYDALADDPETYAIIDLPMGRRESKYYLFLQTIHGKPIVEGMVARMPPDQYRFIISNPLLAAWYQEKPYRCGEIDYSEAIASLRDYGFRYVVIRKVLLQYNRHLDNYFKEATPVFDDAAISVYELSDLRLDASGCAGAQE